MPPHKYSIYYSCTLFQFGASIAAQRFALPALGWAAERRPTGKMIRRRKMLGIAPDSPASGARFVGHFWVAPNLLFKKDNATNLVVF